jgi:hypothetical protein
MLSNAFNPAAPVNLRHVQALVSCIPSGGGWSMCQRLWLFSCIVSEAREPQAHGGVIVTIESDFTVWQLEIPQELRLAVPKTSPKDLNPYIVIRVPDAFIGEAGYSDSKSTIKGIYSSDITHLAA